MFSKDSCSGYLFHYRKHNKKTNLVTDNFNIINFYILTENNLRNAHSYCYSRMFYCSAVRSMFSDSLQLLTTKSMPT